MACQATHGHHDGHGHGPHQHTLSLDADRRWLTIALGIIAAFMVLEVVAGLLAGSLALLSDAAHMLTDAAAIAIALWAAGLAARPAAGRFTFGLGRAEVLSAQANGATLLVLAGVIARRGDPPPEHRPRGRRRLRARGRARRWRRQHRRRRRARPRRSASR